MSFFTNSLSEQLEGTNLGIGDFQRVIMRLLSNQVIYSEQSKVEREDYYQYQRMEGVIADYLSVLGFTIHHDREYSYVILFAPGAQGPVLLDTDEEEYLGVKRSMSANDIALLVIFREGYEQALRSGANIDENGCADLSNEMINTAFNIHFGRPPPTGALRNECFQVANNLRVINSNQADWSDSEGWIKVRPVITSLVFSNLFENIASQLPDDIQEESTALLSENGHDSVP